PLHCPFTFTLPAVATALLTISPSFTMTKPDPTRSPLPCLPYLRWRYFFSSALSFFRNSLLSTGGVPCGQDFSISWATSLAAWSRGDSAVLSGSAGAGGAGGSGGGLACGTAGRGGGAGISGGPGGVGGAAARSAAVIRRRVQIVPLWSIRRW